MFVRINGIVKIRLGFLVFKCLGVDLLKLHFTEIIRSHVVIPRSIDLNQRPALGPRIYINFYYHQISLLATHVYNNPTTI